LDYYIENSI